jgi:hypothetical protein
MGHAGDGVRGTRSESYQTGRRSSGKSRSRRRHENGCRLAVHENESETLSPEGIEHFDGLTARQAEDGLYPSSFELSGKSFGNGVGLNHLTH